MLKIGWGTKIAILYIGFVALVGTMVAISMNQKIDLVSEDYYPKELAFQNQINSTKNANALSERIIHSFTSNGIELQFPSIFKGKTVVGKIDFFRPSDSSKDYNATIKLDENAKQLISLQKLSHGMYKMQISWKVDDTEYYSEDTIVISKEG